MKKELEKSIKKAIVDLYEADFDLPEITVDYPQNEKFGDYSTNVAMVLGKKLGKNPMKLAEALRFNLSTLRLNLRVEVVVPGYINFHLSPKYLQEKVAEINKLGEKFGNGKIGAGVKVNNEFISANPTGPLHLGNGRGGFYGDTLGKVLKKAGFEVVNEYYINDAGEQVMKLGHSVLKDSEAVYAGEYIDELNKKFRNISDIKDAGEKSAKIILDEIIKKTISEKMQIEFDSWISEKNDLEDTGYKDKALDILKNKKLTYEKEGATWLKTIDFGDDKDRVIIKTDGQRTYIVSDCGYILNKIERGFGKIIEIWGADHHGYISRFKSAAEALGFKGELKFIIVQLVRLVKDGKEVRMSKRAGNVVYIDELIDKVGHDVTRFFFLMYSPDTHMNFDLGLAEERSEKNPVYYVQYAHARISSILRKSGKGLTSLPETLRISKQAGLDRNDPKRSNLELLTHEKELSLIKELNKFPELVSEISESYEVHKLPHYAIKLADKFHSFYAECRVIDEENPELSGARLNLVNAVRIVLAEALRLIGVASPNKM